jgi:hypothetical protein
MWAGRSADGRRPPAYDLRPVTKDGRTGLKASDRMSDSGQRVTMEPMVASLGPRAVRDVASPVTSSNSLREET